MHLNFITLFFFLRVHIRDLLLVGFRRPYVMPGVTLEWVVCKASVLPLWLSILSHFKIEKIYMPSGVKWIICSSCNYFF